jgi:hypothetical protein
MEGVVLNADGSDVESIAPGGYLRITSSQGAEVRRLEVRPDSSGTIQRHQWLNEKPTPWDENAAALLSKTLGAAAEIQGARSELERVREEELPRLKEELKSLQDIDLGELRRDLEKESANLEQLHINLDQLRENLRVSLGPKISETVNKAIESARLADLRLSDLQLKELNEEIARIRQTLPEEIDRQVREALQQLESLDLKVKPE